LNTKLNIQTDIRWAFAYFAIVVCLGIFMRSVQVADYPFVFNYRNIVHTHSHLALLGFVYVMLSAILARTFIPFNTQLDKRYRWLFYITQFSVLGMLCSFPFQGYGAISISFSSVFIICTYFFAKFFIKYATSPFVKMGIFYLILSSLGIWFMPVTIVKFGKFSEMYMCSIAFFLHFQYNGWMLSSLMGLFVKKYGWDIQYPQLIKRIFILFQAGIIGSLFISWVGYFSYPIYYIVGGVSVLIWLTSVIMILRLYLKTQPKSFLATVFICFFIAKVAMMFTGAFPVLTPYLFKNIDLLISYLHFNFLGIVTIGLLLFLEEVYKVNRWLIYLFLFCFITTEGLIVYKGFSVIGNYPIFSNFYEYLWLFTAPFYFPAVGWLIGSFKIK
jgi:membrane protein